MLTDINSRYTRVTLLKGKKGIRIKSVFQKVLNESGHKSSKIWVNQGIESYSRSLKLLLHNNGIEVYSTRNKGKSAVAERLIRTLKNKIYNAVSKNAYNNKLYKAVDKDNKTYLKTIKIKSADSQLGICIEYGDEHNDKDLKLNAGNQMRISNYKKVL